MLKTIYDLFLRYKLNIADSDDLIRIERIITGAAMASLEPDPIRGTFYPAYLQAIHKALFGKICDWAG